MGTTQRIRPRLAAWTARLTIWTLALFAGIGVASAHPAAAITVPLVLCDMPIFGSVSAWSLEFIREVAVWGGAVGMVYALFFASSDGGISPTRILIGAGLLFAFGLMWVAVINYAGTEVLQGNEAFINAATCGIDTSGS